MDLLNDKMSISKNFVIRVELEFSERILYRSPGSRQQDELAGESWRQAIVMVQVAEKEGLK